MKKVLDLIKALNWKKALNITGKILTVLTTLFTVFVMVFTIISVNTVNKEDSGFLGLKPYIVLSGSMKEQFDVGDIAISKEVNPQDLIPGDIITFRSIDPASYGEVITHKIREITTYEGRLAFITYGTATGVDDMYPAIGENVIGKYSFKLVKLGYFFQFLRSTIGYFVIIFLPFLLLLIVHGIKFYRLIRQYKSEQQSEINAQKAYIEEAEKKAEAMAEELRLLKEQMAGITGLENQQSPKASEDQEI